MPARVKYMRAVKKVISFDLNQTAGRNLRLVSQQDLNQQGGTVMALDFRQENETIEKMKGQLVRQFEECATSDCPEAQKVAAETATAYAALVKTQLAMQHLEISPPQ
jgi:hypothetical protein